MARARNIKPGFFTNADLVELPMEARLLFIGLWMNADRAGRLEDRPKQIKMNIFPADSLDCNALLDELAGTGMLVRYEVGGKRYLQVVNFEKHQNPHKDEKLSTIPDQCGNLDRNVPAPDKHGASTVPAPCPPDAPTMPAPDKHGASTVPAPCPPDAPTMPAPDKHGASTVPAPCTPDAPTIPAPDKHGASTVLLGLNPDSLNPDSLNPDSLNPDSLNPDSLTHAAAGDQPPDEPDGSARVVSVVGSICMAMKAVGIGSVNPSHPDLLALVAKGADIGLFVSAAKAAKDKGKGFAYALGTVAGQMADAAALAATALAAPSAGARRTPPADNFNASAYGKGGTL